MLIDWFTVAAQALNFLILVWLMKRFLYKPVLNAIDAREKRIATELANADTEKGRSPKGARRIPAKEHGVRPAARQPLEQSDGRGAGGTPATPRRGAESRRCRNFKETGSAERLKNRTCIRRSAGARSRKCLPLRERPSPISPRSAWKSVWAKCSPAACEKWTASRKTALGDALRTSADPGVVRSTFDLPAEQRAAIQNALNETFSAEVRVRFETAPDLIGGIELTANGQKVAWSIGDYLASMENGVGELLNPATVSQ